MNNNTKIKLESFGVLNLFKKSSKKLKFKESVFTKVKQTRKNKYLRMFQRYDDVKNFLDKIDVNTIKKKSYTEYVIKIDKKNDTSEDLNLLSQFISNLTNKNREKEHFMLLANSLDQYVSNKMKHHPEKSNPDDIPKLLDKIRNYGKDISIHDIEYTVRIHNKLKETNFQGFQANEDLTPQWVKKAKSIQKIYNNDSLCGQRCLVLGMREKPQSRRDLNKTKNKGTLTNKAIDLSKKINCETGMRSEDFKNFVDVYKNKENKKFKIEIYTSPDTKLFEYGEGQTISLLYLEEQKHFHFISDKSAFIKNNANNNNNQSYCQKCETRYYTKTGCKICSKLIICPHCGIGNSYKLIVNEDTSVSKVSTCLECLKEFSEKNNPNIFGCDKCKKIFTERYNYVKNDKDCTSKKILYSKKSKKEIYHKCGYSFCKTCGKDRPNKHRCMIPKLTLPESKKGEAECWGFDFEADVVNGIKHKVTMAVCINRNDPSQEKCFKGEDTLKNFCDWIIELSKIKGKKVKLLAHNLRAYDGVLIRNYMVNETGYRPDKIRMTGAKINYMKFKNVEFIDFLNHVSKSLAKMPKTFGLDENKYKKGNYPYLFNNKENRHFVGKIPQKKDFGMDDMSKESRKNFIIWHNKWCVTYELNQKFLKQNKKIKKFEWDHKKETYEYCRSDVEILCASMKAYSELSMKITGIDPLHYSTISSYCFNVFRIKFYNYDKYPLAILSKDEYAFLKRGFRGGRTESFQLHKKWRKDQLERGEGGRYVDICSLYPTVQYYDEMPYGEPLFKEHEKQDYLQNHKFILNTQNYGFYEVDIECNRSLFCPILPGYEAPNSDKEKKLIFSSVPKKNEVYHTSELINAINHGYRIHRIHKKMIFKTTKDMFKDYVNAFLEVKVNNSGLPFKFCKKPKIDWTEDERLQYNNWIKQHELRYGFTPNPRDNPGLRAIAKLMLNNLWGRFSMKIDQTTTEFATQARMEKLYEQDKNNKIEITLFEEEKNGNFTYVQYKTKDEKSNEALKTTNLALGASVTALARTRLHSQLSLLEDRVILCDTDSIIYEYVPGLYEIPTGQYLGDWTLETEFLISEICTTGAKSYGYLAPFEKNEEDKICMKSKGFKLNWGNTQENGITFDNYKRLILDDEYDQINTTQNLRFKNVSRSKNKEDGIYTSYIPKTLKVTANKRTRKSNENKTYPFGYEAKKTKK
jgi:hypothetical protein